MRWRRRKSIVNHRQQIWFGLEVLVIGLGFILLCAFLLFIPPMSDLFVTDIPSDQMFELIGTFVLQKWLMMLVAMGILFLMGMLMAHRFAGPLIGLDKVLRTWMAGDWSARVNFRKYDYILPAKEVINEFLSKEEERLKRIEELAKLIETEGNSEIIKSSGREILKITRENK